VVQSLDCGRLRSVPSDQAWRDPGIAGFSFHITGLRCASGVGGSRSTPPLAIQLSKITSIKIAVHTT